MDPGRDEMAMLRFSLIAPAVNGTYSEPSKAAYYRGVAEKLVPLPGGGERTFCAGTLANWEWRYRHGGFEALAWDRRSDAGGVRALTTDQVVKLEALRDEFPDLSAVGLREKMIELGHMGEDGASNSTFQRYVRNHQRESGHGDGDGKDRRAFQAERPGDLWQADTLFGPYVVLDRGARGRAYCQMIIDDRSRVIVCGKFWAADNGTNFQKTLRAGIDLWGTPLGLYVDHGAPYENAQITGICGRLGIVLRHAPVRDGAAKGKVERNFRTLRTRLLAALPEDRNRTIEELNDLLAEYITKHNGTPHSALGGETPQQVWDSLAPEPRIPSAAELDEAFRNRETRRVRRDATVTIRKVLYDVPQHLVGKKVEVVFTPDDPSDAWVEEGGHRSRIRPTDKEANSRMPREVPRYRLDYTGGDGR